MNYLHFYTTSEHNFAALDLHPQQKQNYSQNLCIVNENWIVELLNRKHKLQGGLVWKDKINDEIKYFHTFHFLTCCAPVELFTSVCTYITVNRRENGRL